eukprot:GHVL01019098.1.p1 GENE.GHVL01019098.1~~GHVL01019098.1.p1  ORF type:complete len:234 (-),score=37.75 GHVL01019098.1:21-722(-)
MHNRIDFTNCSLCGHGFGGAVSLAACASTPQRFQNLILLSPWLDCFDDKMFLKFAHLRCHMLVVAARPFPQSSSCYRLLRLLEDSKQEQCYKPIILQLKNSRVLDQSDLALTVPPILRYFGKSGPMSAAVTSQLQSRIILNFLKFSDLSTGYKIESGSQSPLKKPSKNAKRPTLTQLLDGLSDVINETAEGISGRKGYFQRILRFFNIKMFNQRPSSLKKEEKTAIIDEIRYF